MRLVGHATAQRNIENRWLSIHIAPVTNVENYNCPSFIINFVNYTVISHSDSPTLAPHEFVTPHRARIVGQG
jgi:hypothetical protein